MSIPISKVVGWKSDDRVEICRDIPAKKHTQLYFTEVSFPGLDESPHFSCSPSTVLPTYQQCGKSIQICLE